MEEGSPSDCAQQMNVTVAMLNLCLLVLPCVYGVQVDNAHLSVATLTDDCPLGKMNSIDSAPKIRAVVVGKGADYAAAEGFSAGNSIMPQVCSA
jgi:hypothetical protein